jgi:hypothetical protein
MYDQVLSLFFRGYQFEFYKLTSELLEACMVINFKACGINWGTRKLFQIFILIKKKQVMRFYGYTWFLYFHDAAVKQGPDFWQQRYIKQAFACVRLDQAVHNCDALSSSRK